jgi:protein-tyrosine-phosphatase
MNHKTYNVLFLCAHNAARSIMAEVILNSESHGRFRAFSAGSQPLGRVDPLVLELARSVDYPTEQLRSKAWEEFAEADAPVMDLIITLCDDSMGETCPVWPGHPATAHWRFADPLLADGDEAHRHRVYQREFRELAERIHFLISLPDASLDRMALAAHARQAAEIQP